MNELEKDIRNYIKSVEEDIEYITNVCTSKTMGPERYNYLKGKLKAAQDILERIESQTTLEYLKQSQLILN